MNDPKLRIKDLIRDQWDSTEVSYSGSIDKHTGWYGENSVGPQVTVTNPDEVVLGGGATQISGNGPDGISQVRQGTVLVNFWSGTRDDTGINPKKLSHEMKEHGKDIINDNEIPEYRSLAPGQIRGVPENDHPRGFIYRYEIETYFTYTE